MSDERQLLIDYKTICQMLGIGRNLFFELKASGRFPIPAIRLGGAVRYDKRQVLKWIDCGCPTSWREAKR
jgi:predicted DNA-binding transcriptional regulator AlpA